MTEHQVFLRAPINQSINEKARLTVPFSTRLAKPITVVRKAPEGVPGQWTAGPGPPHAAPQPSSSQASLTCIGRLLAMVKLGMGGRALYVLVRAVSVRPNMEPEVKEETAGKGT